MKFLTFIFMLGLAVVSQAVEYGYFIRNNASADWNANASVSLNANDRFVLLNVDPHTTRNSALRRKALFGVQYDEVYMNRDLAVAHGDGSSYGTVSYDTLENHRTIIGPCSINPIDVHNDDASLAQIIEYKIIRAGEDESKYTVALNADGTRMAIGDKSGTNGVARVFEYNGTDWEQLGSSVE